MSNPFGTEAPSVVAEQKRLKVKQQIEEKYGSIFEIFDEARSTVLSQLAAVHFPSAKLNHKKTKFPKSDEPLYNELQAYWLADGTSIKQPQSESQLRRDSRDGTVFEIIICIADFNLPSPDDPTPRIYSQFCGRQFSWRNASIWRTLTGYDSDRRGQGFWDNLGRNAFPFTYGTNPRVFDGFYWHLDQRHERLWHWVELTHHPCAMAELQAAMVTLLKSALSRWPIVPHGIVL